MDEEKKENPKEEFVKLNLSFEDALKLAMHTPPPMGMDLILNEEQELRSLMGRIPYAGRVIIFKQMEIEPKTEDIHQFLVEIRRTAGKSETLTPIKLKNTNSFAAFFNRWDNHPDKDPTLIVNNKEQVFLTLRKRNIDYNTHVLSCRVLFTLGTKF